LQKSYGESEPTIDLPTCLFEEIGRITIIFSRIEWLLGRIAYAVLGLDRTEGRIAVREPRATERLDMISQLLAYKEAAGRRRSSFAPQESSGLRDRTGYGCSRDLDPRP
jgi:hypothetical protein